MPTFKCTTVFNQGRTGWTETWYWTGSNHDQALTALRALATKRKALCGTGASIEYLRVSDVDILGDSEVQPLLEWGSSGDPPSADQPWNAIYVRVEAGVLYRRQVWLRGVPDVWIEPAGPNPAGNPVDAALRQALNQFRSTLINQGFQLRCINKELPAAAEVPITAIAEGAEGRIKFSIASPMGNVGDEFRVSKYTGPDAKALNGVYKIAATGAGFVEVAKKYSTLTSPGEDVGGKAKPRQIVYRAVSEVIQMRCAKRSTGRAFFSPRGRRSVAK